MSFMLSDTNKPFMLNVVMPWVVSSNLLAQACRTVQLQILTNGPNQDQKIGHKLGLRHL